MAANDRETTFTIKAADLSSQQINSVIQTVERLITVQEKLNRASDAGTVNTQEFRKSLKDLEVGAKATSEQITTLQRAPVVLEELQKRLGTVASLQEKLAEAQAKPEGDRTKRETRDIEKLEKQIESATKAAERQNAIWEATQARLAAMGASMATLDADMARLRATGDQLAAAMTRANEASLSQVQNRQAAAAATKVLADAEKALADTAAATAAAQKAAAAQREADLTAQQNQYNFEQKLLRESLRLVDERMAKEKALAEQQQRIAAQRNLALEALVLRPLPTPLGAAPAGLQDVSKVQRDLSAIIDPATAARQTIDGLTREIDRLANAIDQADKKQGTQALAKDLSDLGRAAQELKRQGGLIDTYQAQEAATLKAQQAMNGQVAAMDRLRIAGQSLTVEDKEHVKSVRDTEAAMRGAIATYDAENVKLTQLRGGLQRAGIDYHNLDSEISRLRASATATGGAFEKVTKAAAGQSGTVFLGLRPYELQNLSYQINDVFTQLGSGTPVMQVLAQQGGQVFQLFQQQIVDMVKMLYQIPGGLAAAGVAAAALTITITALARAMEEVASRRAFAAQLAANVDGATQSVQGLVEAARGAETLGASFAEAAKGAAELAKVGVPAARIEPMLALTQRLSNAFGTKFSDQLKEVTAGFTGSYEAMRKFTAEYGFLTEAQDRRIKALYDENRAEEARAVALDLITERAKRAEEVGLSPLQKAVRDLTEAWHKLLDAVGAERAWTGILSFLATTAKEMTVLIDLANKLGTAFSWVNNWVMGTKSMQEALDRAEQASPRVGGGGPGTQAPGTSRGDRNNNPGNLEFRDQEGAVREGGSGRFARFADQETGVAAALRQYLMYQDRDKLLSVQAMVEKATPPASKGGDNPDEVVRRYVAAVAKELGVKVTDAINLRDKDTAVRYIQAVAKQEGNVPPTAQVAEAGVSRVLQGGVENRNIATRNFVEEQEKELAARRRQFMTEGELLQQEAKDVEESNRKIAKAAQERAEREKTAELSQTEIARLQNLARKGINEQYALERIRRETEVTSLIRDLQDKGLDADKTNLAARLKVVDDAFDKQNAKLKEMDVKGRLTAAGTTYEQALQISNESRQAERDRVALDTAKTILTQAEQQRGAAFAQLSNELRAQNITGAAADVRSRALVAEFKPIVEEAARKADEALAARRGPETQDTRTLRERISLARSTAARPPEVDQIQQAAITQSQKAVDDINKERQARFETIIEREKSGALSLRDAIVEVAKITSDIAPRQAAAVEAANRELRSIRDSAATTPGRKAEIDRIIETNKASLAKEQDYLNQVVQAGLKDALEERDRLITERDAKLAAIAKDTKLSPDEAAKRIVDTTREANVAIRAAMDKVAENLRAALSLPGLTPGARQALTAQTAQNEAVQTTGLPQQREAIDRNVSQLRDLRSGLTDVRESYKTLLRLGETTPEIAEAKIAEAFTKANEAGKPLIETLKTQIDLFEQMGGKTSDVAKLRAEVAKLGSGFHYASDFTIAFIKTLEDSVANRGVEAFDTIAQSIGNAIAGINSWKDVVASAGQAFAAFAAGVLKDIAAMIIKTYILKLVQSAVGALGGGGGASPFDAPMAHSGGVAGAVGGPSRVVDLELFRYARRMHDGGSVGLANEEVPMILQRGERVLSIAEQKMQTARSSDGGGGSNIRNVLAVGDREIAGAMNSSHGERVILNVLQRNAPTVKKYVG